MTGLDKDWLTEKMKDLNKWQTVQRLLGTPDVSTWDEFRFLKIIGELKRENRRLKVQAGAK